MAVIEHISGDAVDDVSVSGPLQRLGRNTLIVPGLRPRRRAVTDLPKTASSARWTGLSGTAPAP